MRSTLDEFVVELDELRSLVASISPVNRALEGHADSVVRQYLAVRRRFDHAAFVVALYASFEKFAENLVMASARLMAEHRPHAELPAKLVKKHMSQSAELLLRGRLGEGRYASIQPVDVVKNLYDCLSGTVPYRLNDAAVVAHDRNLRYAEISELFGAAGFDNLWDTVRRADAMLEWYSLAQDLSERAPQIVPSASIEHRIRDIVDRRNQVAHGGGPLELLGSAEMTEWIAFVQALCEAIFSSVAGKYLNDQHVAPGSAVALRVCEGPYQGGRVVVVDRPSRPLFIGQPVFALANGTRWGRILHLQVDDHDVENVDANGSAATVGIELDFKCTKSAELYALDVDDDALWTPLPTPA